MRNKHKPVHASLSLSIYIYIERDRYVLPSDFAICLQICLALVSVSSGPAQGCTANLHTKILDFRGFGSSRIVKFRGGILMSIGNIPEILSQRILAGIILLGRLGLHAGVRIAIVKLPNCSELRNSHYY